MSDIQRWLVRLQRQRQEVVTVERWPADWPPSLFGSSRLEDWQGQPDLLHCEVLAEDETEAVTLAMYEMQRRSQVEISEAQESTHVPQSVL